MATDSSQGRRDTAARGKYRRLYSYLCALSTEAWKASFSEIELVVGFQLPPSARRYSAWWANERGSNDHSHVLAWSAAGWETAEVNMAAETLLLRRKRPEDAPRSNLQEAWPVHSTGAWPEGLSLRREDVYEDRG